MHDLTKGSFHLQVNKLKSLVFYDTTLDLFSHFRLLIVKPA